MKQSFTWWSFGNQGLEDKALMQTAAKIGYKGVELLPENLFPLAKDYGLTIATHNAFNPLERGLNKRENHTTIFSDFEANLKLANTWGIETLICFSGNQDDVKDDDAKLIMIDALKQMMPLAEDAGVQIVLEMLNSKVDHTDYHCDTTAFALDIADAIDSKNFKLLYDVYHMQIMEGDIIRTIQTYSDYFGHYHTGGNPGRNEIGVHQEIAYAPIFKEIKKTEYQGFIGHEFTPTGDVTKALQEAFDICEQAT